MKSVFWWRKPEYPDETTDLRQVTDETFHTYDLCPVRGLNLGRSGVKQSELRRDESFDCSDFVEIHIWTVACFGSETVYLLVLQQHARNT